MTPPNTPVTTPISAQTIAGCPISQAMPLPDALNSPRPSASAHSIGRADGDRCTARSQTEPTTTIASTIHT